VVKIRLMCVLLALSQSAILNDITALGFKGLAGTPTLRRVNALKFLVLAIMACNYLAILATSPASERVFSTAGNIVTKNQNRLAPTLIEQLISLNCWGTTKVIDDSAHDSADEDD